MRAVCLRRSPPFDTGLCCGQLLILLPLMYFSVEWLTRAGMSIDPADMPGPVTALGHMVVFVLVEEVMFYYSHRLLVRALWAAWECGCAHHRASST